MLFVDENGSSAIGIKRSLLRAVGTHTLLFRGLIYIQISETRTCVHWCTLVYTGVHAAATSCEQIHMESRASRLGSARLGSAGPGWRRRSVVWFGALCLCLCAHDSTTQHVHAATVRCKMRSTQLKAQGVLVNSLRGRPALEGVRYSPRNPFP